MKSLIINYHNDLNPGNLDDNQGWWKGYGKSQVAPDLLKKKKGGDMMGRYMIIILLITFMTSGNVHARLHAETSRCDSTTGKVLKVVNNEFFTVEMCEGVKTFEELTYCYGVNEGDRVIFDWDPHNCEVVSFSVLRNRVQCGVRCP